MNITTQSPEADLDRELEELMGKAMRGTLTVDDKARWIELQSRRTRMMRPVPAPPNFSRRKYA
ncbi:MULTISPECIES: hypothetical protein [unclassified Sphingomonas]|uniref:hypothetical protein n=1 Tax=unclassified Sphingomonas TaxID=196159 RepID=UPI001AC50F15|nr:MULTISPECIES: hypothetical protein [unclassified Sphingomonas]MBN8849934.1 hypothetical protein [Sphingomonas sp.]